uniref:Uncharacterized protein n=1 Tax=Clytia hemisphaerica TaxID=252671 RepID=A0A7M5UPL1_9CNID
MGNLLIKNSFMKDQECQTKKLTPRMKSSSTQTDGGSVINEIDDHTRLILGIPIIAPGGAQGASQSSKKSRERERIQFQSPSLIVVVFTVLAIHKGEGEKMIVCVVFVWLRFVGLFV